jgi:hypothetical protein
MGGGVAAVAALALLAHAVVGSFSRYIADDFCTASSLHRLGFLGSQAFWYETWSGRYAFTAAVSAAQTIGPTLTPWLPFLVLAGWVGLVAWVAFGLLAPSSSILVALALGAVHALTTLEGTPTVYQSLYWETGVITYTLPLILGVGYAGWLVGFIDGRIGPRSTPLAAILSALAAFVLGGFSETFLALQATALALALVVVLFWIPESRRRAAWVLGAGILGSLVSLATMLAAPGTAIRRGLMPEAPGLGPWTEASLRDTYLFIARTVKGSPAAIALAILVPLTLVFLLKVGDRDRQPVRRPRRWVPLIVLPVATPLLMLSTIAPYEYAVSSYPDGRVLVTTMFVLVGGMMLWAGCLGATASEQAVLARPLVIRIAGLLGLVVVAGVLLVVWRSAAMTLGPLEDSRAFAAAWDTRDQKLRDAARQPGGVVPAASLRHMGGLAEIGRDPDEWINRCVAGTYGLEAVIAK